MKVDYLSKACEGVKHGNNLFTIRSIQEYNKSDTRWRISMTMAELSLRGKIS